MPVVYSIVRQYGYRLCGSIGIDQADLVQEGMLALVQAFNRYDPALGASFRTYAFPRIRGAIMDFLRDQIIVSRSFQLTKRAAERFHDQFYTEHGRQPSDAEYCAGLGITEAQWENTKLALVALMPPLSVDAPMKTYSHWQGNESVADLLLYSEPNVVEDLVERMETITEVRDALGKLPPMQQAALRGKYFTHTLARDTAKELDIKTERVTRLNRQGIEALRGLLGHLAPIDGAEHLPAS